MSGRAKHITVFLHVPKTGGTAVAAALAAANPNGLSHCERLVTQPELLSDKLASLDWLSGHVKRGDFQAALEAATGRPLKFYSILRDPTRQIASHYNWLIEIYHRGTEFYESHAARLKEISEEIRRTDNSNPAQVIGILEKYRVLFLNYQSRFVLQNFDFRTTEAQIPTDLTGYTYICAENNMKSLIGAMTGRRPYWVRRANVSRYHIDQALFAHPQVQEFLLDRNSLDLALYRAVQAQQALPPT